MQKVAIIIPTLNRIDFLIRTIHYYVSINSPHPLFIGDASDESSEELVLNAAQGDIEIYYYHWKNLSDRRTLIKLAEKASQTSSLNFCAFQGDDDFFISDSLEKCADFLNDNSEYATAQGRAISIELTSEGPYGDLKDFGVYWDKKELNGETAEKRLEEIIDNYWVPIFSVHRLNEFIEDISNGLETITDRNFGEYANSMTIAMRGKSKFIECFYLTRNIHSGINHESRIDWILGKDWYTSYNELISSLSSLLSRKDNLSLNYSSNFVKSKFDIFLKRGLDGNYSLKHFLKYKYSTYIIQNKFWKIISQIYRRIKYLSLFPAKNFSNRGLRSKKSKYNKEILKILNSCSKDRN